LIIYEPVRIFAAFSRDLVRMAAEIYENLNERLLDLLLDDTCKNLREGVQRAPELLHIDAASVI
jgi:hypothetical protein